MKHFIIYPLLLLCSIQMIFAFEVNGVYYMVDSANSTELKVVASPNSSYSGVIEIPSELTREGTVYKVTSIDEEAFARCKRLKEVRLPSTIKTIGEKAFANSEVQEVVFTGNGLTVIPYGCFGNCQNLRTIRIPQSVKVIKRNAFKDCPLLNDVEIPSSVEEIQGGAFSTSEMPKDVYWSIMLKIKAGSEPLLLNTKMSDISFPCKYLSIDREIKCYPYPPFGWKLKNVDIGRNVTKLTDELLFQQCTEIERIVVFTPNPPIITEKTFAHVAKNKCTLYVPKGAKLAFATAQYWSEFHSIVEQ